jgi:hypothetical protein
MKLEFFNRFSKEGSSIIFHQNPSNVESSAVRADGRTDGRIDMTMIIAFSYFANAPENGTNFKHSYHSFRVVLKTVVIQRLKM